MAKQPPEWNRLRDRAQNRTRTRTRDAETIDASNPHLDAILARRPGLRAALQLAIQRYGHYQGVVGFGIGVPFNEKRSHYHRGERAKLGVKVFVWQKKTKDEITKAQAKAKSRNSSRRRVGMLPKKIVVGPPLVSRRTEIPVDVVSCTPPDKRNTAGELQTFRNDRPWPSAGAIAVGRLFGVSLPNVPIPAPGGSLAENQVDLGTVGALVETIPSSSLWGVTSAHVFVRTCAGQTNPPEDSDPRGVGGKADQWAPVPLGGYRPLDFTIGSSRALVDAIAFEIPASLTTSASWPPGFKGELAPMSEIQQAVTSVESTGFIWVEREPGGRPTKVPVDLEAMMADPINLNIQCGDQTVWISHAQVWPLRLLPAAGNSESFGTLAGDSGAGVFLQLPGSDEPKLFGFHFFRWDSGPSDNQGPHAWAVRAKSFLEAAFGAFDVNFRLHMPS